MIQNPLDPKSILHVLGPPIVKFKIQSKDVNILNQQCDELISNKKYRKQLNVSDKLSKTVRGDIQEELTCELKNNKMNFYELIDLIKKIIDNNEFTNKITFGDLSDVDLNKETTFPLLHLMVDQVTIQAQTMEYRINVIAADIVDKVQYDIEGVEDFYGNDNVQDIMATQLQVTTMLVNALRKLDLVDNNFTRLQDEPVATPFKDRFENEIAGWETTITLKKRQDGSSGSGGAAVGTSC